MSDFSITGTVSKVETLTSSKGNPYMIFSVLDDDRKGVFELSLFGNTLSQGKELKEGVHAKVTGSLVTQEYTDKNGKVRYALKCMVERLDVSKKKSAVENINTSDADDLSEIPF